PSESRNTRSPIQTAHQSSVLSQSRIVARLSSRLPIAEAPSGAARRGEHRIASSLGQERAGEWFRRLRRRARWKEARLCPLSVSATPQAAWNRILSLKSSARTG